MLTKTKNERVVWLVVSNKRMSTMANWLEMVSQYDIYRKHYSVKLYYMESNLYYDLFMCLYEFNSKNIY